MINNHSKIQKLIAKLCPDGVEFREIGKIVKILRGKRLTKNQLSDEEIYPVYHGGLEPLGNYSLSNRPANTVMVINVGASAGAVGYSGIDFWSSDGCFCVGHSDLLISRYAYYALLCYENILRSKVRFAGIPTLDASAVECIKIPVPPLAIQEEIVWILDTFTNLEAELEAELEARKIQYEYYRDELLTFGDEVERIELGKVCTISSGGTPSRNKIEYWKDGNIPWLKSESCNNEPVSCADNYITLLGLKNSSAKLIEKNTTLMALVGATIFKTAYLEFNSTTNQNIAFIKSDNSSFLYDKYIFYALTNLYKELKNIMRSYGMLNLTTLKKIKIPIPPLPEQERIVAILDRFDALVNDISIGLPAELNARRKQYEYYRNQLLTFKEKGNVPS
jgi:type I restriction enzyme S subunit